MTRYETKHGIIETQLPTTPTEDMIMKSTINNDNYSSSDFLELEIFLMRRDHILKK